MPPKQSSSIYPRNLSRPPQSSLSSLPLQSSSSPPVPSSSSRIFSCTCCDQSFSSASDLIKHVHMHVDGLLPHRPSASDFSSIGFSACKHCRHYYRVVAQHERHCHARFADLPPSQDEMKEEDLPDLDQIFSSSRPTLSYVPAAHRQAWGRVLTAELNQVCCDNSVEAWTRLFMLPKCVLAVPKRGGKRNRGDRYSVSDLCAQWEQGKLSWLWSRGTRPLTTQRHSAPDSKRILNCAIHHARNGRFGRACAALSTSGLAPDSKETIQKLKDKHPDADPPDFVMPLVASKLQLNPELDLLKILRSFAKEVGTDGTNLRIQHLLDNMYISMYHKKNNPPTGGQKRTQEELMN